MGNIESRRRKGRFEGENREKTTDCSDKNVMKLSEADLFGRIGYW